MNAVVFMDKIKMGWEVVDRFKLGLSIIGGLVRGEWGFCVLHLDQVGDESDLWDMLLFDSGESREAIAFKFDMKYMKALHLTDLWYLDVPCYGKFIRSTILRVN